MSDIIVTHRHGMLAIYTRNGTAELTQRAIVDVGDDDLQSRELIDIADELAHRFGWQQRQLPPARGQVPKALAAAQAKQNARLHEAHAPSSRVRRDGTTT